MPASGGTYVNPGDNTIVLPIQFKNWRLRVYRNNVRLDYGQQISGDPYWIQDLVNNTIGLSSDAEEGDKFIIEGYKPATD